MEYFKLNNNVKMPSIGYGVWRISDQQECERCVLDAINSGYRYIDTAQAYGNEEAVGNALKKTNINREELFISTKLDIPYVSMEKAREGVELSLKRLGLEYLDLLFIHQPYNDYFGAWKVLEQLYKEGKIRAIGVDNFTMDRLADFLCFQEVIPTINFIKVNVHQQCLEDQEYLNDKNILMQAWSPLSNENGSIYENEVLIKIANKHKKSVAQVVLRWLHQRNIAIVTSSTKINRMKENIDIFNFKLDLQDMKKIKELGMIPSRYQAPRSNAPYKIEEFIKNSI